MNERDILFAISDPTFFQVTFGPDATYATERDTISVDVDPETRTALLHIDEVPDAEPDA